MMEKFIITTVETVYREYEVEAVDESSAKKRLRTSFDDPLALREGVVRQVRGHEIVSKRRITGIAGAGEATPRPKTETADSETEGAAV